MHAYYNKYRSLCNIKGGNWNVLLFIFQDEDEECRIFAAAKRKMMKLRAEKELEIHKYVI